MIRKTNYQQCVLLTFCFVSWLHLKLPCFEIEEGERCRREERFQQNSEREEQRRGARRRSEETEDAFGEVEDKLKGERNFELCSQFLDNF